MQNLKRDIWKVLVHPRYLISYCHKNYSEINTQNEIIVYLKLASTVVPSASWFGTRMKNFGAEIHVIFQE